MIRLIFVLLAANIAFGHEVSESFLSIERNKQSIHGRWEVALRDLEIAVGIDGNQDDAITWGEFLNAKPKIAAELRRSLRIGNALPKPAEIAVVDRPKGKYVAIEFSATPGDDSAAAVHYDFMFEYDRTHRALLKYADGGIETVAVLTDSTRDFRRTTSRGVGLIEFIRQGVIHIWEGADHIAFLLTLLLPAVIGSRELSGREALLRICKIVTAFTVAHSITLALATLDLVRVPSRLSESAIALSVLIAAANNLAPVWKDRSWAVAFAFGLIHGFGFASALSELQLQRGNLAPALFGFNAGVEIGQLAIVALFFPIAFAIRESWFYRRLILLGGSAAIALLASAWLIERALAIPIFSTTLPR